MSMWPFKKKSPKLHDQELKECSEMFYTAMPNDPTPGLELLGKDRLDYSLESLKLVDDFLEKMQKRKLTDKEQFLLVLRCGAYVGEVIRRQTKNKTCHWLDYKGACQLDRRLAEFGEDLGTIAIFWDGTDGFSFPLGKVGKFLDNGREDSVYFFAKVLIARIDEKQG